MKLSCKVYYCVPFVLINFISQNLIISVNYYSAFKIYLIKNILEGSKQAYEIKTFRTEASQSIDQKKRKFLILFSHFTKHNYSS